MNKSNIKNEQICFFSNFKKHIDSLIYGVIIELIGLNGLLKDKLLLLPTTSQSRKSQERIFLLEKEA